MKILIRGINLRAYKPKPIICPSCGCVFKVEVEDVKQDMLNPETNFVICPNSTCKFRQNLRSERMKQLENQIK